MRDSHARLLVAEDNRVNRLLLMRNLELLGHAIECADNGVTALEMLRTGRFDLMLLDMEMPRMDGFQVLQQMTAEPLLREIPVIVTSALEGIAEVVRCIELGADDFLRKPVNPVLLKARIGSSLEKKRLRDRHRELVRRFATVEVAQDLEDSGFALGGRYVHATAMFSDIRGFTALAESQAPQETIDLLNSYYALMFDAITAQGGVVNQMVGDGLMAIFGAPRSIEEPALCAVRAALDMQAMIDDFNLERAALGKPLLKIGVGVATGEMIAGYTGTKQRATYTCVGDAVNVAARLEAYTKTIGRGIAADAATYAALRGRLEMERMGSIELKGKAAPTEVYAI